jgi:hypothetical protein
MSLKYIVDESNGKSLNASHPYSRKCNPYGYEKALTCKIHMSATCGRSVVSSTNKTKCQNITEILLKVVLNTIA